MPTTPAAPAVRVTPAQLTGLGDRLAGAGGALEDSLGMRDDPAMWTAAEAYQEYFGPATQVAATYAAMARALPEHVRSAAGELTRGGEAFRSASRAFADAEARNAAAIGRVPR